MPVVVMSSLSLLAPTARAPHRPAPPLPSLIPRRASRHLVRAFRARRGSTTRLRVAAPTSDRSEPSTSAPSSGERFVWRDHWYPVSLVEDLDPRVPTPFQLLNRDLVIWKDPNSGDWSALDDRCPHRLAPLSVRSSPLPPHRPSAPPDPMY